MIDKLTSLAVSRETRPGLSRRRGGVSASDRPAQRAGASGLRERAKPHEMGLGPFHTISLTEARAMRLPPSTRSRREGARPEAARAITFKQCAGEVVLADDDQCRASRFGLLGRFFCSPCQPPTLARPGKRSIHPISAPAPSRLEVKETAAVMYPRQLHNALVARAAPSASAASFAQPISACTRPPMPQSAPPTTFSRPTMFAQSTSRRATSSGCSTMLVA